MLVNSYARPLLHPGWDSNNGPGQGGQVGGYPSYSVEPTDSASTSNATILTKNAMCVCIVNCGCTMVLR